MLIITICVFGMLLLVASQIFYTQKLVDLNDKNKSLLRLGQDFLQLRRHEKDFLLRLDLTYVDKFNLQAEQFLRQLAVVQSADEQSVLNQDIFNQLADSFPLYQQQFTTLVQTRIAMGLNENIGYQGEFREATHKLEAKIADANMLYMHQVLLQMRRAEKDFLLRKDMEYVDKELGLYSTLRQSIEALPAKVHAQFMPLLSQYQQHFMQLVDAYRQVGLDHESGLQGRFRNQAHLVEQHFSNLDQQLQQQVDDAQRRVEMTSIMIMLVTSAVLIILLIRSFLTLQRAFSHFVMFFYRCKREYQHMDEKSMGFSEFKYLAAIANEMIDSRRQMERELKAAQDEISRLKQVSTATQSRQPELKKS
ncbi:hypothetical protein [Paraglaciecola mesophila]|uniref:hypothetical protein n=1 Tax=Paraglaciecola mesophila TaxID=197222 RepID=UPI00399C5B5A